MTFVSYAQNYEDVLLWRALGGIECGFYIDVGASHPDTDSVTRAFFDRGWRGINIEPVEVDAARIAAARPGDITLQLALSSSDGETDLFAMPGTGLSTVDAEVAQAYREPHWKMAPVRVATRTLAGICRAYVRGPIHFLKIDVEGAEYPVLAGADLQAFRPWIILVEATAPLSTEPTHVQWEPHLQAQGYRFVWFDGLNRFYLADEHADRLSPHFQSPPNVFDGFIRSTDVGLAAGMVAAERHEAATRRAFDAALQGAARSSDRATAQAEFARHELIEVRQALSTSLIECQTDLHFARHELQITHRRLQAALDDAAHAHTLHEAALQESTHALAWLAAVRSSTSWRLTGPLRVLLRRLRVQGAAPIIHARLPSLPPDPPMIVAPAAAVLSLPPGFLDVPAAPQAARPEPGRSRRAVHQFHSGSAVADAITNAMLLTRALLRQLGYESEIYVTHRAEALAGELRLIDQLPRHDGYVLIVRHSMGHDEFARIVALPAPKVLIYHNITPPDLLAQHPFLASYAALGRRQLAALPAHVHAALADSEFNAIELRQLGFEPVRRCTLLFDSDAMRRDATHDDKPAESPFTVMFVGRICQSKGQLELIAAWREFRVLHARPALLVLVGRSDGMEDAYAGAVETSARTGAYADEILLTGLVSDAERDAWYGRASLYVSLSRHEGFGVPLVEAMAHGVPVLALGSGAVPYTLDNPACLLPAEADAARIGAIIHGLAGNPDQLAALGASLCASLDRFALPGQMAILHQALLRAGATMPDAPAGRASLDARLHFTVTGHVNSSYSLAAVNRGLALTLEAARPGMTRLVPVEGVITSDLSGVPGLNAAAIAELACRAAPLSAPELVISQHYPVHVPPRAAGHGSGQIRVALLFWEESLLPAATIASLQQEFDGVVAPTWFVARALVNSGLRLPVRVIDHAPPLDAFHRTPRGGRASDVVGFLHVSSCFPRKGVDLLLEAWAARFTAADPVRLVIKTFANPHNQVAEVIATLRARYPGLAPISLIEGDLDEAAMAELYAGSDVMVLPSRGEGYNLPAAEALAAGMRLIVTGAGGHMDFCDAADPRVRLLRWHFAPSASHLATPHSLWLQPDRDDLVDALHEAFTACSAGPADRPATWHAAPLGNAATADAFARFGTDLLLAARRPTLRIGWISSWNQRCGVAGYSRQLLDALAEDADQPDADSAADITVFCDRRTPVHAADLGSVPHHPCWDLGMQQVEPLLDAIARLDPDVVVMQHQPGLAEWPSLVRLIDGVLAQGRVMTVTLHNCRDLLELPPGEFARVLAALSRVHRVIVHTLDAINQMAGHGLADQLVLFPQGSRKPRPAWSPRSLAARDAPMIGSTGFFLRGKGIGRLIEAALLLRHDWPRLQLRLVNAAYGSEESAAEIACARIAAAPLGDRVQFITEFLAEGPLLDRLVDCDIIMLPYEASREASSAAMRTALTSSVPVAVSQVALFDEADNAVFRIDATDAGRLAAGIDQFLRDQAARVLVQNAAQSWMDERAWLPIAKRLLGMLIGLVRMQGETRSVK